MPDISKCTGGSCPKKENCWRYLSEDSRWQTYFGEVPNDGEQCEHYWPMEEE